MIDPNILFAAAVGVVVVLMILAWKGVLPKWLAGVLGGVAVVGCALMGRKPAVVEPPRGASTEPVRGEAEKVLSARAKEDQDRIEEAVKGKTPEQDLADLMNARARKP